MKQCPYCSIIEAGKDLLYEDEKVAVMLKHNPATTGHILVMPKEHYPIIEQIPDYIIDHLFCIVNKISVVLFESFKAEGTNIVVSNGIAAGQEFAHFLVNIIPRKENDGLNFQWQPRQLTEEQMSTVEMSVKQQTSAIGSFEKEKEKPVVVEKKEEVISDDEENYLIKQLRRIP